VAVLVSVTIAMRTSRTSVRTAYQDEHLDERHEQEDPERLPVAQDVERFFAHEAAKAFMPPPAA
jgi:hypothetical protein